MFHTSAFSGSIANTGDLIQLTEIPDSILPASGIGLLSNALAYIMAVAYVGADLVRGQFQAPSLRDYGNLDTQPINIGTAFESPPRLDDFSMKPIPAAVSEEWDMFAAQDNAMASEIESGFLWSSNGQIDPVPPKKIVQIHWDASITLDIGAWSAHSDDDGAAARGRQLRADRRALQERRPAGVPLRSQRRRIRDDESARWNRRTDGRSARLAATAPRRLGHVAAIHEHHGTAARAFLAFRRHQRGRRDRYRSTLISSAPCLTETFSSTAS